MRCPFAIWIGSPNETPGGFRHKARGVVLHVEEGTEAGTESWFQNRSAQASAHFGVGKDGRTAQFVDTDDKAWAQMEGNPDWYSIETEGIHTEPMTDAQVHAVAHLYDWLAKLDGIPYQLAESPTGTGLGWHGMGGAAWGRHLDCPGDQRRAQRQHVLDMIPSHQGVKPMYSPPLPVAAVWQDATGKVVAGVAPDGGVFAWGCAYRGGPNGKPYFAGHAAAAIGPNPRHSENPGVYPEYVVTDTGGGVYGVTGF